jgi:HEAT repeat protein
MLRLAPLAALLLLASGSVQAASAQADGKLEDLLAELARDRDDADPEKLYEVASIASRDAMQGLVGLYTEFSSIYMRREVLRALARFDGVEDAEQPALQHLMDVATSARERELREAALEGIGSCAHIGKSFLVRIVESPAADELRERALELHLGLGSEADHEWYRALYEPTQQDDPRRKKPKSQRKNDEDEEAEKVVHRLESLRAIAFGAVAHTYDARDLVERFGQERNADVRLALLEDLHRRGEKEAGTLAHTLLDSIDVPGTQRAAAARIVAEVEGKKCAKDFITLAKKQAVTPEILRETMATLLAGMDDDSVDSATAKLIGKGKPHEKRFALLASVKNRDPKLLKKIRGGLRDKDPGVRSLTVDLLGRWRDRESVEELKKLIEKERDVEFIADVMEALSRIEDGDNAWVDELLVYAAGDARETRNAAVRELGRLGRAAFLDVLAGLLVHADWSTRLAALRALETMHRPEILAPIVAALDAQQGRLLHEFADTLWRLTGQPHRARVAAWQAWYAENGEGFALLEPEELEQQREQEEARKLKSITKVEFFGVRIRSQRVIFIIDISGSMNELLRSEYVGRSGEARIERAKAELTKAIEALEEGTLFNVVTFASGVDGWLDGGIAGADGKTRKDAIDWVKLKGALGGTNLYDAVKRAFNDPDVDTIVVLSDGEPTAGAVTDPSAIREDVARWNKNRGIVIHTIAVGGQLRVLEWLAADSGGDHVKYN